MARKRGRDEGSNTQSKAVGSPKGKGKIIASASNPPSNEKGLNLTKKKGTSVDVEPALDPIERRLKQSLALGNYQKYFKTPNFIPERELNLYDCDAVWKQCSNRLWGFFVSKPAILPNVSLVREVYALMSVDTTPDSPMRIRNKNLRVNPTVINAFYRVPAFPLEDNYLARLKVRVPPKKGNLEELRWRDLFTQNECMRVWFNTMKEGAIADRALQVDFIKHSTPDFNTSKYAQYPTAPFEFPLFQHPCPFGPPQNTLASRSNETPETDLRGNQDEAAGDAHIHTLGTEDGTSTSGSASHSMHE